MYKCNKCNKVLTSAYNYERHLNRKTSCDIILQCIRCDKIFNYQRELNTHANRKFPCKITSDNIIREEREKDRQLQIQLAEQKNKILVDIQDKKNNIAEEKIKIKIIEAAANAERIIIRKEEIASREILLKLKIQADIDSQLAKTESRLAIVQKSEQYKLERKQETASVINNNITITNVNIYTDSIKQKYKRVNVCFSNSHVHAEDMYDILYNNTIELRKFKFLLFFNTYLNTPQLIQAIIEYSYNNKQYPKARNIFYNPETKKFYVIYINNDIQSVEEVDYNTKLRRPITTIVCKYFAEILKYEPELSQFKDNEMRFKDMQIGIIAETIKNMAMLALTLKPPAVEQKTLQMQN